MSEFQHPIPPSPWVTRFASLIPDDGQILDLACGKGRHTRYLAEQGRRVCAVDRNEEALNSLKGIAGVEILAADLETGNPWPLAGRKFAGIVVATYLHRPSIPAIIGALAENGILIYETFALGNEAYGKPSNPDFLLRPGELLDVVRGKLQVVAFEQGKRNTPRPAIIQRICAVNSAGTTGITVPVQT